jgi:MerR family transcriptional regulator, light-induced transcriptional regulator
MAGELLHPIGVVARRTGLSEHTIRAWERRYEAVVPERSEGGQRLYSDADVLRLRLLKQATDLGHSIGRVSALALTDLVDLAGSEPAPGESLAPDPRPTAADQRLHEACLEAVQRLDGAAVYELLMRAVVTETPGRFVDQVAVPLLRRIGELWVGGGLRPAEEHVFSVALRRVLGWLTESVPAPRGAPTLLLSTPAGQRHEFGAMLAGVVGVEEGWRVVYLGADLPAAEIADAARRTGATAVALSAVIADDGPALLGELREVRRALSDGALLLAGGAAARREETALRAMGVMVMHDFDTLRATLRAAAPPTGAPALRRDTRDEETAG